jgi:peptidyl-dipeptidase A
MLRNEMELNRYLNQVEERLESLSEQIGRLSFQRFVDKKPNAEIALLEAERGAILLDPVLAEAVMNWVDKAVEPRLVTRLAVWKNALLAAKVPSHPKVMHLTRELNDRMLAHQYNVGGRLVDLGAVRGILRGDPDRSLRESAFKSLGELSRILAPDLLALINLRNSLARELGFETYVDLTMAVNGMSTSQVEALLHELTEATDDVYKNILSRGAAALGIDEIAPWDVQYILEQGGGIDKSKFPKRKLTESLNQWLRSMGHEMSELGISPEIVDIPYNGLCMGINRKDIRILFNPQDGFAYYKTAYHELGHALHSALNEQEEYILRRESGIFTEGVAEIFGYVPQHPLWLKEMGLTDEEAEGAQQSLLGPLFHYLRQRTSYCLFEHAMYKDTGQDLHQLMAGVDANILGCTVDSSERWAANGWFISYPVYWHNYVIADVIASQVHEHLRKNFGELYNSKEAFDYVIKTYISPGASKPWLKKIEDGTGYELKAKALIKDLR